VTIRIDPHTLDRLDERGTTAEQVYTYDGIWRGRFYRQKSVRVVFAMLRDTAVTVTVVVYFGFWGQPI
jgi:hypothetical protein